ncbi:MAG: hypothetical protein ACI9JN_000274 [Bacteroidia bacterium]
MSARPDVLSYFKVRRIIIPLVIGFGVSAYFLFWKGNGAAGLKDISWTKGAVLWLLAAVGLMIVRDFGYMLRLRILSDQKLSWKQCFQIIMLWEFASAISPGAIGGTAAAVVIMAQEKLKTGLTTAIVLITSFLDELYYMIMTPIAFWAVMNTSLFPDFNDVGFNEVINTENLRTLFWSGYIFLLVWTIFLAFALFIKPEISRGLIRTIVKLPFLKRFRRRADRFSDDLLGASIEFRSKPIIFWLKSMGATVLTWTARFLVINCLIMLLNHVDATEHWIIFGKQVVMWILLMIAITPGGSGIAELIFPAFMGPYLPTKLVSRQLSVLWRLITYYPYILIGVIVLPVWLKRVGIKERFSRLSLSKKRS